MPEHVHLLIHPCQFKYRIAALLSSIKKPVGEQAIRYLKRHAPSFLEKLTVKNRNRTYHRFWQAGAGQDRNLYDPRAVHRVIEYIHANPVRRGLVNRPEDWLWSSAADWTGANRIGLRVDRSVPMLND